MACKKCVKKDKAWQIIRDEAVQMAAEEPMLASFFHSTIINHDSLGAALSFQLANKLGSVTMPPIVLREVIEQALRTDPEILNAVACDICAVTERDPAVNFLSTPLLYLKGFRLYRLIVYRIGYGCKGRLSLAYFCSIRFLLFTDCGYSSGRADRLRYHARSCDGHCHRGNRRCWE